MNLQVIDPGERPASATAPNAPPKNPRRRYAFQGPQQYMRDSTSPFLRREGSPNSLSFVFTGTL